jgi:hypothetical protein
MDHVAKNIPAKKKKKSIASLVNNQGDWGEGLKNVNKVPFNTKI